MLAVRILIVAMGLYYIIAIGILQFGLNGPVENRLASKVGKLWARIIYSIIGVVGIVLVFTGIL